VLKKKTNPRSRNTMEFIIHIPKNGRTIPGSYYCTLLLNQNGMCFTTTELQHLKNAVTILQPFEAATRETSAKKFSLFQLLFH